MEMPSICGWLVSFLPQNSHLDPVRPYWLECWNFIPRYRVRILVVNSTIRPLSWPSFPLCLPVFVLLRSFVFLNKNETIPLQCPLGVETIFLHFWIWEWIVPQQYSVSCNARDGVTVQLTKRIGLTETGIKMYWRREMFPLKDSFNAR